MSDQARQMLWPQPSPPADSAAGVLRMAFLRWQCRVRQVMMREDLGRPGPGIMPDVLPAGGGESLGQIITVMNKTGPYDKTPEMQHMVRRTNDPAARREAALKLFSEFYYQKPHEFSDMLCAGFAPGSPGAAALRRAERLRLRFAAFNQRFDIPVRVWTLTENNPAWQATWWHNALFNPALSREAVILGFAPDWTGASADPAPHGARQG